MKQSLFQVNAETQDGNSLPVGPAMIREACEYFARTIHEQIRLGHEKSWRSVSVVPILHSEN